MPWTEAARQASLEARRANAQQKKLPSAANAPLGRERMLRQNMNMPAAMQGVMGGPTAAESEAELRGRYQYNDRDIAEAKGVSNSQAAAALAQGGAKSAPVPVHSGAAGRSDHADAWAEHEAEQKLNRGVGRAIKSMAAWRKGK